MGKKIATLLCISTILLLGCVVDGTSPREIMAEEFCQDYMHDIVVWREDKWYCPTEEDTVKEFFCKIGDKCYFIEGL